MTNNYIPGSEKCIYCNKLHPFTDITGNKLPVIIKKNDTFIFDMYQVNKPKNIYEISIDDIINNIYKEEYGFYWSDNMSKFKHLDKL